jgi:DNA primase
MVSSVLSPEKVIGRQNTNKAAAQNFISGGSVVGASVINGAANKIVGFQSRYVGEVPPKLAKYYKKSPANYVYGLDNQKDKREYVIVTEGEFDALLTSGVALGSNNISDRQIQLIEDLNIEPILLPDADKPGRELVERAADYGWSVSFPEWEGCKDVGDAVMKYGRLFAVYSILQAAEHSPTKIRLIGKKYCQ